MKSYLFLLVGLLLSGCSTTEEISDEVVNPLNTATGLSDVLEQPIVMQGSEYNLLWISEVAGAIPKTVGASLSKINDQ